jgi:hypothetical protein
VDFSSIDVAVASATETAASEVGEFEGTRNFQFPHGSAQAAREQIDLRAPVRCLLLWVSIGEGWREEGKTHTGKRSQTDPLRPVHQTLLIQTICASLWVISVQIWTLTAPITRSDLS